jgi:hypothetical protein
VKMKMKNEGLKELKNKGMPEARKNYFTTS